MEILSGLSLGFDVALTPMNIAYCFVGVLVGTMIGVLPGIGPTTTTAMLLPLTFGLPPVSGLIMLAGIYYGAQYGGSTTAILINLPGEVSSTVTVLDGYQMARQGRAGVALATAAIGSFFAGTVATFFIAFAAPPLTAMALSFGAPEYFSLLTLGLILSIALAHGSVVNAVAMLVMGLLFGLVGTDIYSGAQRFTFGKPEFAEGLDVVAIAVGLFACVEILRNLEDERVREVLVKKVSGLLPSMADLKAMALPILRGTAIGSVLGVLPGGGAVLSSFAAYGVEKKLSRTPERFGRGAIEGVAAPESANNAGAQTSFIPMLTLGIPASPVLALMIGAMTVQGIQPGPEVMTKQPALFWGVIASMWVGNLLLLVLNLPLVGIWVRLLTVPYRVLFPAILVFGAIGVYGVNGNAWDVYTIIAFGLFGYVLVRLGCEPTPFLLGFVLGPLLEENLRRSMILTRGDPLAILQRPLCAVLLGMAALALLIMLLPGIAKKREEVFVEDS